MSLSCFLHTVKWFQILLCNSHNLTSVFCLHTVYSIGPIDKTIRCYHSGSDGPGSNGNEGVVNIPQNSKVRTLPSDGLISYLWYLLGVLLFFRNAVSVFYSDSWLGYLEMEKRWIQTNSVLLKNWPCVASCSCKMVWLYIYIYIYIYIYNNRLHLIG